MLTILFSFLMRTRTHEPVALTLMSCDAHVLRRICFSLFFLMMDPKRGSAGEREMRSMLICIICVHERMGKKVLKKGEGFRWDRTRGGRCFATTRRIPWDEDPLTSAEHLVVKHVPLSVPESAFYIHKRVRHLLLLVCCCCLSCARFGTEPHRSANKKK